MSCLYIATFAQNTEEDSPNRGDEPCARPQIETNPFDSKNTEWFSMRNRFNWMDYVTYHNGLKMSIPYFDKNDLYGGGLNSQRYFVNPFFDDNEAYLRHINLYDKPALFNMLAMDNDYNNYSQLVNQMDITSKEQGWELLWKFDGYESDGTTPISNASINQIKSLNFILYNRYTGMLRWFMAPKVNNTTFNELEPVIKFKNSDVASLFRNYNGLDQALDKPTIVQKVASPAQTSSSTQHLSMADFSISYDPCVCYFDSKLEYTLNANTTASIDLYGRLEGTSQMLSANDAINTDRLLSLFKNNKSGFTDEVKNGLLEYKNYGKMVADFKKLENKSNIFDDVYDASKVAKDIAELGIDFVLSTKKPWKSLKTISKFVGFASMPFKTDKTTKSPPMLIQAQMTLTGQLNSSVPLNGFSFDMFTPGSYKTSSNLNILNSPNNPDRFEYPVYNQAMGLYALLKTPQKERGIASLNEVPIKVISVEQKRNDYGFVIGTTPVDSVSQSYAYSPRVAYKLKEDIEFTFNPSAQINFEKTRIEAAWIIEVENAPSANTSTNLWNLTSLNMSKTYSYVNSNNKHITVYSGEFIPIECISQFVPVFDFALTNNALRTDYINPLDLSHPHANWLLSNELFHHINVISTSKPKIVNTYLKINILYRYNKPGGTGLNDIVNFETYKYEIEGTTANNNILSLPNIIELSSPSELIIENRDFTANETIFAWDKITLKGFIKTSNGASVVIRSAGEIIVEPETEIDPEITLLIGNPSLCNPTRIQPTAIDASYCNNQSKYKGNTSLAKADFNSLSSSILEKINYSSIYPNPTSTGNFIVETILETESFIKVYVYDIAGKLVFQKQSIGNLNKGSHKQEFNSVLFQNGLYLVEVETNLGKRSYKLIKN